jgi:long-chain acyl-CoA synthetase
VNLADFLLEETPGERIALVTESAEHTYDELRAHVGGVARALEALGVEKGNRVGLLAEPSLFWVACYLGVIARGAIVAPFAPSVRPTQLAELARLTDCRVFCVSDKHRKSLAELPFEPALVTTSAPAAAVAGEPVDERRDLAALMFTSGSTGTPRAVMVSHRNIIANTTGIIEYLGLDASDRVMAVLPFHYCFGASLLHTHLRVGGRVVINNHFAYPQLMLDQLERAECTGLAGVPSTYQLLLRSSSFPERRFPALRWLQQAGGKLPNVFIEELLRAQPQARYYLMYGQTEATARLSYLPPERLATKLGSIGRGMPGVELGVLRPDGTPVAVSEVGELVARGDNVALGYWHDPEETARTFRDGALWTGDLARVDEDGFFYVVDRAKDFIKPSGHRTAAKEVEDYLVALRDVVEAAAVGVPDDLLGEAVAAFVVLRRGSRLGRDDVLAHCRSVMPAYMVPRELTLLPALPKTSAGKVAKMELRERALGSAPR